MRSLVLSVRAYGCIFVYTGDAHKSITGTMFCYKQDVPKTGGVIIDMPGMDAPSNMYIMLCGCTTPEQRRIIRNPTHNILNYFITETKHPDNKVCHYWMNFLHLLLLKMKRQRKIHKNW